MMFRYLKLFLMALQGFISSIGETFSLFLPLSHFKHFYFFQKPIMLTHTMNFPPNAGKLVFLIDNFVICCYGQNVYS